MKYIIIGTTAINRPELHNLIINEWCEWITKDRDYKVIWFINIDIIENLKSSLEETQYNYERLLKEKVDEIYFLNHPENKGNFFEACKRLAINIKEYVKKIDDIDLENDIKIVWLEDDWKLNINTNIEFKYLINNYSTKSSCINLTFIRRNYIWALAPCIISFNLFNKLHYNAWILQEQKIDPEYCLGLYYLNNYTVNKKDCEINNLTIINQKKDVSSYVCIFEPNSYYTYYDKLCKREKILNKYIENINECNDNTDLFIRITPSLASDFGRQFMQNRNLLKNKNINDENSHYIEK